MRWPQRSHPASVLFSTIGLPSNPWKKRQLKPERLAKVVPAELMRAYKVTEVQLDQSLRRQGPYPLFEQIAGYGATEQQIPGIFIA
jgi:hypothetical protein